MTTEEIEIDWEQRRLCSDGACLGVLDGEGVCPLCTRVALAAAPYRDVPVEDEAPPDDERRLCSDGACVGLIGDDGNCRVCRAPA